MTESTPDPTNPSGADEPGHDPELLQLADQAFDFARTGDTDRLAAYIDAGVPVDFTNDRGDTLLMLAAYHGHTDSVKVLLQRGADPNRANEQSQTPLAGAVFKSAQDVIDALIEGGADPSAGAPSAIDTAIMFDRTDLLKQFGVQ
ncbi:ankyrin repeat domain-containing protein [Streptomyces sp. V4-01]|uniref:Ankyrin repeat domain-containing protein n=1 Tax=Actinacidiphila polyblastidii TaxID=3110430 RepID=A0ABU7PLC1_9ACTN|nr:ankyrin repeat domain-containing protein [Streptomyces sp. V4-01]